MVASSCRNLTEDSVARCIRRWIPACRMFLYLSVFPFQASHILFRCDGWTSSPTPRIALTDPSDFAMAPPAVTLVVVPKFATNRLLSSAWPIFLYLCSLFFILRRLSLHLMVTCCRIFRNSLLRVVSLPFWNVMESNPPSFRLPTKPFIAPIISHLMALSAFLLSCT